MIIKSCIFVIIIAIALFSVAISGYKSGPYDKCCEDMEYIGLAVFGCCQGKDDCDDCKNCPYYVNCEEEKSND